MTSMLNNGVHFVESLYDDLIIESPKKNIFSPNNEKLKNWKFEKIEYKDVSV